MDGKQKKILKRLFENNHISMKSFLISYCGIYDQELLNGKVTHNDIKLLLPYLERKSFEYIIKNICEVYRGEVILVKDYLGNIIPYVKPNIKTMDYDIYSYCDTSKIEERTDIIEEIDLDKLNKYELIELRKKCKTQQRTKYYRKICRLIKEKKDNDVKDYHKNKEKIIMKGRLEYDKY